MKWKIKENKKRNGSEMPFEWNSGENTIRVLLKYFSGIDLLNIYIYMHRERAKPIV